MEQRTHIQAIMTMSVKLTVAMALPSLITCKKQKLSVGQRLTGVLLVQCEKHLVVHCRCSHVLSAQLGVSHALIGRSAAPHCCCCNWLGHWSAVLYHRRVTVMPLLCRFCLAGAVTSWRYIADQQLRQGMVQMMRYLHDGMGAARWADKMQQLDPGMRAKLEEFCR
jgi:hypothetical protein